MIHDLGIIMLVAGAISVLFKWLKQPVVLGYIVAGILAGPYVCGSSWVNVESAETWGQVGVIFLLFTLGLEFSFKKLVAMGSTAFIGCITIVVGMMSAGFLLGRIMGWDEMNSLFLGGMLCMSSTTIVFKALDDLGLRQERFAGICFGILVVEDLFAVVLMVLLASIAVKQQFDGQEMIWQVGKLSAYLLFWFVAGIMLIPTMLRRLKAYLNDETMTIMSLGLCLGMVLLAEGAGFSAALGAFVMGSILAETLEAERIERLMGPIKNLFGAIFFVSVGMMIDPAILAAYWLPITIITLVVILGQIVFASAGIVMSGEPLRGAMKSAFALTQVGEFAFIIAQFGESMGVTQKFLYPVIVAVSVITTFLTPYTIRLSEPAYRWVEKRMPARLQIIIDRFTKRKNKIEGTSHLRNYLSSIALTFSIYVIVIIFVMTGYFQFLSPLIVNTVNGFLPPELDYVGRALGLLVILACITPFVYKIIGHKLKNGGANYLWNDGGTVERAWLIGIGFIRIIISISTVGFCIGEYFSATKGVLFGVTIIAVVCMVAADKVTKHSRLIEDKFKENLNARENDANAPKAAEAKVGKTSVSLGRFEVYRDSPFCNKTLAKSNIRQLTQCNVLGIEHEGELEMNPGPNTVLHEGDIVIVGGEASKIKALLTTIN